MRKILLFLALFLFIGLLGCSNNDSADEPISDIEEKKAETEIEEVFELEEDDEQKQKSPVTVEEEKVEEVKMTDDEEEYFTKFVLENSKTIYGVMDSVDELFAQASEDPTVIRGDSTWQDRYLGNLSVLSMIVETYLAMSEIDEVPTIFEEAHEMTLQGYSNYLDANVKIFEGATQYDEALMREGADLMGISFGIIEESERMYKEIVNKYD